MTQRHFVCQDKLPEHLAEVDLAEVEPSLRSLLFTDGTVTRTLEVQALSRVSVQVVEQCDVAASASVAAHLDTTDGTESTRRRVVIGTRGSVTPLIWAESHILPSRLPSDFLNVLEGAPDGIGQSLQQVRLESWRELLWLGLDSSPRWNGVEPDAEIPALTRLYRVMTSGRPALLITETFAVERGDGTYRLRWAR